MHTCNALLQLSQRRDFDRPISTAGMIPPWRFVPDAKIARLRPPTKTIFRESEKARPDITSRVASSRAFHVIPFILTPFSPPPRFFHNQRD